MKAAEHLHYIRSVMERSQTFTAVPGYAMAGIGLSAIAAAYVAHQQASETGWLIVWLSEGAVATAVGGMMLARKARAVGVSLRSGPARKYFLGLAPPLGAGAVLTDQAIRSLSHRHIRTLARSAILELDDTIGQPTSDNHDRRHTHEFGVSELHARTGIAPVVVNDAQASSNEVIGKLVGRSEHLVALSGGNEVDVRRCNLPRPDDASIVMRILDDRRHCT